MYQNNAHDEFFMQIALRLAKRGVGLTAPNPSVGCVIVKEGRIIGRGWTAPGGRPHAETQALQRAEEYVGNAGVQGAVAYVTLEPCSHHGNTSPCAEALVRAGIARVVVASEDPDQRVNGKGIAMLQKAGVEVVCGVGAKEAEKINQGFLNRINLKRPYVTLKLATSVDGKIATRAGESQWLTGEEARNFSHLLRMRNDAVMVGVETIINDNPTLTCRLNGLNGVTPIRIVMDSKLRTPKNANILKENNIYKTWILTCTRPKKVFLNHSASEIIRLGKNAEGRVNIREAMRLLAERGINHLLLEGGGTLAANCLKNHFVDEIIWFHAPKIIGGDGKPSVAAMKINSLLKVNRLELISSRQYGEDIFTRYRCSDVQ